MTKVKKAFLGFILAFLMLEVIIISPKEIGVPSRPDSPLLHQSDTSEAQQSMRGVHLIEAKNEKKEWELWSDQAFTSEGGKVWKLINVKVKFFGQDGVFYDVTGMTGEVDVQSKDVKIEGKVRMISSNAYYFQTEHIGYKSDAKLISTQDPVFMTGGQKKGEHPIELKGVGLSAKLDSHEIKILKDIRSKKELESREFVYIESDSAEFSAVNKYARYLGEVTIDYMGSRITGPSARFDYDPSLKAVTSLLVEGGAKVTDLTKWATAKSIQMLFNENKFILKGAPRVVQDNDELIGDEITFLDGGKEIIVKGAKAEFEPKAGDY